MFDLFVGADPVPAAAPECQTQPCIEAAKSIKEFADFNADPCDDFYQYACGNWLKSNPTIPDDKTRTGTLTTIDDENKDTMRAIYEGTYDDLIQSITWQDVPKDFHVSEQKQIDEQNFQKVQDYYNVCMDVAAIDAQGPTPAYPLIAKVMAAFENGNAVDVEALTAAIIELDSNQAASSLFDTYIDADDKQPDIYAIKLSQPSLTLPKAYYAQPDGLEIYRQSMVDLLDKALGGGAVGTSSGSSSVGGIAALKSQKAQEANLKLLSKAEISATVDRFIQFEKQLASISLDPDRLQDPRQLYNPMPLADLQAKYPLIDWKNYFESLTAPGSSAPDYAIVQTPSYFANLTSLLQKSSSATTASTDGANQQQQQQNANMDQAIKDYFMVKTLLKWLYALDSDSRDAWQPVYTKLLGGTTAIPPRYRTCVSYTDGSLGMLQGRYFVMRKFGGDQERDRLENIIATVHETLLNLLAGSEWLDKQTLEAAIQKANAIKYKVAYSTLSPDERVPQALQDYYSTATVSKDSFMATELSITAWQVNMMRSKIDKPLDKNEWHMTADTVNAYYNPSVNEIAVLAGIAQSPVYSPDVPDYLLYGSLGFLIGHELTHAFDRSGRLYDPDGKLNDWWSAATAQHFEERSQCFIEQYNGFSFQGPNNKTVHLNGKLSLGENMADNGGVVAAYTAFEQLWTGGPLASGQPQPKHERLPGINLSPEALFFVSFARDWCSMRRPESSFVLATTDPHALERFRVIGPLQNNPKFSEAFQCPSGSYMNPQKKCTLW
ncbi:hypothetical protein BDB00DRAFT_951933 [Zychaea mexicana]|uniref:uncharacterized protein n=1 Tax=Zychaea mexicana TaxID=64656 RepID=UPI0022FEAFD6|nr:uncharacterized protein BDB00DRAFT_951933 [Zychaea mexicana]KAI9497273.1 hypothetical protein BDB00DRAFT_951933 [Zychaea mexicana]